MIRLDPIDSPDPDIQYQSPRSRGGMTAPPPMMPWQPPMSYSAPTPSMNNYFSDPLLQQYLNTSLSGMSALSRPTSLASSNPALDTAIAGLTKLLGTPDTGFDYLRPIVDARRAELQRPGYTPQQLDMIRTLSTDPMTAQRDAQRQQIIQRFASLGQGPSSGPVQEALAALDRQYAGSVTTADTQLAVNAAQQDEQRRNQAVQMATEAAGLAGRNLPTQLSAANALAGVGNTQQQLDLSRQQLDVSKVMQAMGLSRDLSQLPIQLQNSQTAALNALQGPIPQYQDPSIQALLSLMGVGQNAANQSSANTTALWGSLIGAAPGVIGGLAKLFGQNQS